MPPRVKVVVRRKAKKIPLPVAATATESADPCPATAEESHIDFASLSADQQLAYEVALFGEAAENHIPISAPSQAPDPCSKLIENRQIQAETNRRYEESLLADQRKTKAAEVEKVQQQHEDDAHIATSAVNDILDVNAPTLCELRRARIARFQNPVTTSLSNS